MAAIKPYYSTAPETCYSVDVHHAAADDPDISLPLTAQDNFTISQNVNIPSLLPVSFAMDADDLSITPLLTCWADTAAPPADVEVVSRSSNLTLPLYQEHLFTRTVPQEQSKFAAHHTHIGVVELALQAAAIPSSASLRDSRESAIKSLGSNSACSESPRFPNSNQSDDRVLNPVAILARFGTWHNPLPVRGSGTLKAVVHGCRSEEQHLATPANNTSTTAIKNSGSKLARQTSSTSLMSGMGGWDYAVNIYLRWVVERQYLKQRGILFEWARESLSSHFIDPKDLILFEFLELFEPGVTFEAWLLSNSAHVIRRVVRRRVLARQKLTDVGLNRLLSEAHLGVFERMTDEEQAAFISTLRLREARVLLAEEGLSIQDYELEDFAEASSNDRIAFIRNRKREEYEKKAEFHGNGDSDPSSNTEESGQLSQFLGPGHGLSVIETLAATNTGYLTNSASNHSGDEVKNRAEETQSLENNRLSASQSSVDKFTTTQGISAFTEWTSIAGPRCRSCDTDGLCRTIPYGSTSTASILTSDSACSRRAIRHIGTTVSSNTASVLSSEEIIPLARVSAIAPQEAQEVFVAHETTTSVVSTGGKPRRREHIEFNELPTAEKRRSSSTMKSSVSYETQCEKEEAWNASIDDDKARGMVRKISQFFGSIRIKVPRKSSVIGITA